MRWLVAAISAVLAAWAVRYAIQHWDGIYDDAFIYLRYVRNLDSGCGLRFNCAGPAVEGFTGPLYLAALWLGSLATDQLIWWCQVVGTACVVGTLSAAVFLAARMTGEKRAALALAIGTALVLGLDDFVLLNSTTGLETAMAALACTLLAAAVIAERPIWIVAAACAAVLVRPEAVVLMVALPILPAMRRPRVLAALGGFVLVLTLARLAVFGQALPNTFYAKSGGTLGHASLGLSYIVEAIRDFPLILLAPLALLGKRRQAAGCLLAGAALWFLFFLRSGGDTFSYSRLAFPLVPMLSVLALTGVHEQVERRWPGRAALAAIGGIALVVGIRAAIVHDIPPQGTHPRVVEWSQIGTYLRTHEPKGTLIATVPIGAIGYYSNLPLIDLVGLTEPEIARAGRSVPPELLTKQWIGHERNNTEYVLERAPALIVTTMIRETPWSTLAEARAGFYADWLLLQEIKAGRAPYHVRDAEIAPGRHLLMLERNR